MKTVELFCASPASTAICSSMDQRSMVRRAIRSSEHHSNRHGGLPKPPKTTTTTIPCSSQIPFSPTYSLEKRRKNLGTNSPRLMDESRRKRSADVSDLSSSSPPSPTSSRYLLSVDPIFDLLSESKNTSEFDTTKPSWSRRFGNYVDDSSAVRTSGSYESPVYNSPLVNEFRAYKASLSREKDSHAKLSSSNSKDMIAYKSSSACTQESDRIKTSSTQQRIQIVELKVSIHCKGCEGKIRKHISRMEGVTSFSIDLPTKKVTIVGNVTPLEVLSSISKVKYAEFWSSPTSSSSTSSPRVKI